jgi:hypothetical protein
LEISGIQARRDCFADSRDVRRHFSKPFSTESHLPIECSAIHVITSWDGSKVSTERQTLPPMPKELAGLFDVEELKKYLLPEELAQLGMGGN